MSVERVKAAPPLASGRVPRLKIALRVNAHEWGGLDECVRPKSSIALHNLGILFEVGGLRAGLAEDHRLAGVAPVIVRFGGKPPRRSVKVMKRVRSAAEVAYGSEPAIL
jgi:hypothetical protein